MTPKNAVRSPASYLNAHDSEQQAATVYGNLQYRAGVPNNARMLKGVLHVKNYTFIKSTLVTDGKKELLFGEGAGQKVQRRFLRPASSYAHTRRLVRGFWSKGVEMAAKVAEVRASRGGAGGGGERGRGGGGGKVVLIGDVGHSRLFWPRL